MPMKEYLKWTIVGSAFLIPFLAFVVVNDMFFPYIVGKNFGFRILVEIMFGAWIVLAYIDEQYRPKLSYLLAAIAALVVVIGVADVFGANFDKSFWSNYERMDGYVTTIHLFAYFLVMSSVFKTRKMWDRLFHVMIITSVLLALRGLGEVFSDTYTGTRLATTLGNAIYLAVYMLFHMFITAYYLFKDKISNWKMKHYLYIGAIILQFLNLYYTATRGTLLGLIGGVLLIGLIIAVFEKKNKKLRTIAIGLVGSVILFVSLFIAVKDTEFVQESRVLGRFATISLDSGTVGVRFTIWDMAYEGFKEKPILGWGQGNFPYVFNKYYDPSLHSAEPWFDRAHNVFLDWLIAGGILGLLAYLSIFAAALRLLWKRKEDDFSFVSKAILTGFLAAYFFHNIFVFDNLMSYILFFTLLAYLHARSTAEHERVLRKAGKALHRLWGQGKKENELTIVAVVLVVIVGVIYMFNYHAYAQNKLLIRVLRTQDAGQSLVLYKEALKHDSFGNGETRERLVFQARQVKNKNVSKEIQDEYFAFAIEEINKQMEEMPGESKYPLFASSLYSAQKDYQGAIDVLQKGLEISPKKDLLLMSLGDLYINTGQPEEALKVYKEAHENANGENATAAVRYAHAALHLKDEQLASDILTPIYGTHRIPNSLILNIYGSRGQFDIVRDIYIDFIEREPKKPEYRFQLTGVYLQLEERDKAVETLEQAMSDLSEEEYPTVHNDAKKYIEQIKEGVI